MLKIRELIKRIRACKAAEEKHNSIDKESAEIPNLPNEPNASHKARNKNIYMQLIK